MSLSWQTIVNGSPNFIKSEYVDLRKTDAYCHLGLVLNLCLLNDRVYIGPLKFLLTKKTPTFVVVSEAKGKNKDDTVGTTLRYSGSVRRKYQRSTEVKVGSIGL